MELSLSLLMEWSNKMETYKVQWPITLVTPGMAWLEIALESVKLIGHGLDLQAVMVCQNFHDLQVFFTAWLNTIVSLKIEQRKVKFHRWLF